MLNLRVVVSPLLDLLTFQSGGVIGDLRGLDSCVVAKMGVDSAEKPSIFDGRVEFREL